MHKKHSTWFEGEIKPVRPGVYRRRRVPYAHVPGLQRDAVNEFNYFDGTRWRASARTVEGAYSRDPDDVSGYQALPWQGLSEAEAAELARAIEEAWQAAPDAEEVQC